MYGLVAAFIALPAGTAHRDMETYRGAEGVVCRDKSPYRAVAERGAGEDGFLAR